MFTPARRTGDHGVKGLGEISPKEFAQFIGKEMRLSKVQYAPRAESGPIFNFYMGKNAPALEDCIRDKSVMPVEECGDDQFLMSLTV